MNLASLQADLWTVAPELWLLGVGLLTLLLDLVVPAGRKAAVGLTAVVGLVLALIPTSSMVVWQPRPVLVGTYAVDGFAVFLKIIAIVTAILVILSATDSMGRQTRFEGEFYALLVFTALGLMLMAASTDLILLALSIEYVSLTSYVLAGFLKGNPKSNEAGIKYFLFGATASAVMFYGFSLVYGLTGTTNLYQIAQRLSAAPVPALYLAVALMLAGFGFKISMVDRKSTRLNSSHSQISYAVFCLKKKKKGHSIVTPADKHMIVSHADTSVSACWSSLVL